MEMNAQATKIQAAENDLKQLMADVTRAMEKAQEAVARIAPKAAAATTNTEIHDFVALERVLMIHSGHLGRNVLSTRCAKTEDERARFDPPVGGNCPFFGAIW